MLESQSFTFMSIDTVVDEDEEANFSTEFLNSLDLPHDFILKIGLPIINAKFRGEYI